MIYSELYYGMEDNMEYPIVIKEINQNYLLSLPDDK